MGLSMPKSVPDSGHRDLCVCVRGISTPHFNSESTGCCFIRVELLDTHLPISAGTWQLPVQDLTLSFSNVGYLTLVRAFLLLSPWK